MTIKNYRGAGEAAGVTASALPVGDGAGAAVREIGAAGAAEIGPSPTAAGVEGAIPEL